jgi:hypothetical protein
MLFSRYQWYADSYWCGWEDYWDGYDIPPDFVDEVSWLEGWYDANDEDLYYTDDEYYDWW